MTGILQSFLKNLSTKAHKVIHIPPIGEGTCLLDLSNKNIELYQVDVSDTAKFNNYIFSKIKSEGAVAAIGGYNEVRAVYARSSHFSGLEPRNVHIGVDVWIEAGTPVYAPLPGKVHSFRDNKGFGDYGPTIILEHTQAEFTFYTLYGHLTQTSLVNLYPGKVFNGGEKIAEIGPFPENGDWPPHLHFQVITDMLGTEGDFPGVVASSQHDYYLSICPDPMPLLGLGM